MGKLYQLKKENLKNSIVKFEQINISLENLSTSTIKIPKLQETPTHDLLRCILQSYRRIFLIVQKVVKKSRLY